MEICESDFSSSSSLCFCFFFFCVKIGRKKSFKNNISRQGKKRKKEFYFLDSKKISLLHLYFLRSPRNKVILEPDILKDYNLGRPLQGRNIPGCSAVISRRQHFRVLYGINQFQNQFSRIWNRFKPESSGFFKNFAFQTSLKIGFTYLKPVYTRKYSKK